MKERKIETTLEELSKHINKYENQLSKMDFKAIFIIKGVNGVSTLENVSKWQNPRLKRHLKIENMHRKDKWKDIPSTDKPLSGDELADKMMELSKKYGCEFIFDTLTESE